MSKKKLHVGIILDGNRRFAKKLGKQVWKGHEYGAEKVEKLLDWAKELDIGEMTLYCFSMENFNREKKEVEYLIKLFKKFFKKFKDDKRIGEDRVQINFIGDLKRFDDELQELMNEMMERTKDYGGFRINFLMGYGGRWEIIEGIKKIVENNLEVNEEMLENNLLIKNEPDLIIRTGGEMRGSGFLPWQSVYSEWFYLEKLWPEFEKEDLVRCIDEFKKRDRRFGE